MKLKTVSKNLITKTVKKNHLRNYERIVITTIITTRKEDLEN